MAREPVPIPPPRPVSAAQRSRYAHEQLAQGLGGLASEQLGDLEFRLFLDPVLSRDPLGRMGYDPERFRVFGDSERAFYVEESKDPAYLTDTVYVSPEFLSSPDVMAHEYRHRGIKGLYSEYEDNPELFGKLFDPSVVDAVAEYGRRLEDSPWYEERIVEHFDDLSAVIPDSVRYPTMEATLDYARPSGIQEFQDWTRDGVGRLARTYYPVQSGVMEAAQGILRERGEPPRAEFREPGILDRIRSGIGALFGG